MAGRNSKLGANSRAAAPNPYPGRDSEATWHCCNKPCVLTWQCSTTLQPMACCRALTGQTASKPSTLGFFSQSGFV